LGTDRGPLRLLLGLLTLLVLAWALGLFGYASLTELERHRRLLGDFVAAWPLAAGLLYVAAFMAATALAVPIVPVLTMAGGLLFGRWAGALLALPAATLGACILFLAARRALASPRPRPRPLLDRLRDGLRRGGFWYLLSVRLIPVVPFSVGSVAPALVGMRLPVFIAATVLGILPSTVIFADIGARLDQLFARGEHPDLGAVLAPPALLPLFALAALSLAASRWRRGGRVG
jgi:uncharacterized membrane protein YdjX (TVP38/TMEM64 family)